MTINIDEHVATLITVVATGLGTVLAQLYREHRNHQWVIDERNAADAQSAARHEATQKQVAENTALTRDATVAADAAYREANSVNVKIESLGIKVADVEAREHP